MEQFRADDADLDLIRPRMSGYGSKWFMLLVAALAGGTLAASFLAFGKESPVGTWVFGSIAIVGPYVLVVVASRRVGGGGRGRGVIRACGPMVILTGSLLMAAAIADAREHTRRGRPLEIPITGIVGGPLLFVEWVAGFLAILVARPSR